MPAHYDDNSRIVEQKVQLLQGAVFGVNNGETQTRSRLLWTFIPLTKFSSYKQKGLQYLHEKGTIKNGQSILKEGKTNITSRIQGISL